VELGVADGLDAVAALAIAPRLERLRVEAPSDRSAVEATRSRPDVGARFGALRSLDLSASRRVDSELTGRALPALRELSLPFDVDAESLDAVVRAFGPQLDALHWTGEDHPDAAIAGAVRGKLDSAPFAALVAGDVFVGEILALAWRPLEIGNFSGPWFERGVVAF
jgi:hypothetical protein